MGVQRRRVHLGDGGIGVHRRRVHLGGGGIGVYRQLVHIGSGGSGVLGDAGADGLHDYLTALARRLRYVRVCCGDWTRVVTSAPTVRLAPVTAIFLDPPYDDSRDKQIYRVDSPHLMAAVREWSIEHGSDARLRIALCGYDLEMPRGWIIEKWSTHCGYANLGNGRGRANATRETVAFSPHCQNDSRSNAGA